MSDLELASRSEAPTPLSTLPLSPLPAAQPGPPPVGRAVLRIARRLLIGVASTALMLLVASVLIFALVRSAPGDPVEVEFGASGADVFLTAEQQQAEREQRREELGLDGTVVEQYARWLGRVVQLDLGVSYRTGRPVADEVAERLPASAMLGGAGFLVALLLAWLFALLSARRPDGTVDHGIRLLSLSMAAVPTFLSGSILLRLAADVMDYPLAGPASWSKLWLPALVMGMGVTPTMARVLRASLIAEGGRPYALAARARGASPSQVMVRHVMRPATTPLLTLAGLALASLIAGSVITETVFAWPGIGAYAVGAIAAQDFPVVQTYVLVVVLVVILVNRAVDGVQVILDPRTRRSGESGA